MKHYSLFQFILIVTAVLCAFPASGLEVECRPGQLHTLVKTPGSVNELVLKGTADASDLFFVSEAMPALGSLDMSQLAIAAYEGEPLAGLSVYPAATIPRGVFAGSRISVLRLPSLHATVIGDCAFASTAITSLEVPPTVMRLGQGAFCGSPSLQKVTLHPGVVSDGYAFSNCPALTSVNLNGAAEVGPSDYESCTALAEVTGSAGVVTIGDRAFAGCRSLADFYFPHSLKTIGESAFAATGLTEIQLDYADAIGPWAFAGNTSLADVRLPGGESELGEGVFMGCRNLTNIELPVWLYELPDYALASIGTDDVFVPSHVTTVGAYALACNRSASVVSLPATLDYIGDYAMEGLKGLRKIRAYTMKSVPELGEDVWKGVDKSVVSLVVAPDMADAFAGADQWRDFDITPDTSGTETSLQPGKAKEVSAYFDGDVLVVESAGADLGRVDVYDPYGHLLTSCETSSSSMRVPTADFQTDIFIVRRTATDGAAGTFKIAR